MFQVQCLRSTNKKSAEFYSKYSIGPFLKGQSITVGNALRRVLLSNLTGLAIISVRIANIEHEFSTIPGVKEDVVDILLNLKQLILKGHITEPVLARLVVKKSGIITAENILLPHNITLVNPDQYIACLTEHRLLEMEFLIAQGQNYVTNNALSYKIPKDFLSMDAIFMPVLKVNFFIETANKRSGISLESLLLEIWTNGSLMPDDALKLSSAILANTFNCLKASDIKKMSVKTDLNVKKKNANTVLKILIEDLELSKRPYNCLKEAGIETLADLVEYSSAELLVLKNFGQQSLIEVCSRLEKKFNLKLQ
jgi:DNA-directed RNA polymerase subunit alpha